MAKLFMFAKMCITFVKPGVKTQNFMFPHIAPAMQNKNKN